MSEAQKTYYSQHPVPQHVLGVEFKLVGGLTVKQFAYAGGSIVLAYLIYSSILPLIFKIPLAIVIAILGISIALLPVNERPMDEYLKNFLVAITSPTERVWIKEAATLDIFYERFTPGSPSRTEEPSPKNKRVLREYIGKMKAEGRRSTLDLKEEEYLKSLSSEFETVNAAATPGTQPVPQKTEEGRTFHAYRPERFEVRPAPNLASEVNFTNQDIISIPAVGRTRRFVTSIKNVKAGRKLHSLPTVEGEIVMPVAGEIVLGSEPETSPNENLLKKAADAVSVLNQKMVEIKVKQGEAAQPQERTEPPVTPPPPIETVVVPILRPTPEPSPKPLDEGAKMAGRVAVFGEELEKLKKENEELLLEIGREKKMREEAERVAEESRRYQERIHYLQEQNEKLSSEVKRVEEDYKKVQNEVTSSKSEKENSLRTLREQQRRLEALSREKTESVDELVRLQKELQMMRGRAQRTAQEEIFSPPIKAVPTPETPARSKPTPFVKDLPNVINGYVLDKNRSLVKNAVIIVKDQNGDVVRALKTNDLGQFAITTPLPNGLYHIETSAPNNTFDIITVDLVGTVLEPAEFVGR